MMRYAFPESPGLCVLHRLLAGETAIATDLNGGAFTFADIDDVEAQLLKPGNGNGVKAMTRVNPNTAQAPRR
jgi:hypothetical protein